jgi:hypothetical protein
VPLEDICLRSSKCQSTENSQCKLSFSFLLLGDASKVSGAN